MWMNRFFYGKVQLPLRLVNALYYWQTVAFILNTIGNSCLCLAPMSYKSSLEFAGTICFCAEEQHSSLVLPCKNSMFLFFNTLQLNSHTD